MNSIPYNIHTHAILTLGAAVYSTLIAKLSRIIEQIFSSLVTGELLLNIV